MLPNFSVSLSPAKQKSLRNAEINDQQPSRQKIRRYHRRLSEQQKFLIVFLRYDSLENFNHKVRTVAKISKRLGLPYTTVKSSLDSFVRNGYQWKKSTRRKIVPENVRKKLLSKSCLEQLAAYSLRERIDIIERDPDLGYKFSLKRLHTFYRENGVKFR